MIIPSSLVIDKRIAYAKIHPGIGVGRVGNSKNEFYIGPEYVNAAPLAFGATRDKTGAIKRQAARFRIYGYNKRGVVVAELTPDMADIEWKVELANKKSSWYEFYAAMDQPKTNPVKRRNPLITGEQRKQLEIRPSAKLSYWGGTQLVATAFIRDPYGCGWHLDRQQFDQNLRDAAEDAGALMVKGRISSIAEINDGIQAKVGEQSINADWAIDASGNSRVVASVFGVSRHRDAPLFALYAWCSNNTVDTRSVVETVPTGWWYTAGLPDKQRVLAFFSYRIKSKSFVIRIILYLH